MKTKLIVLLIMILLLNSSLKRGKQQKTPHGKFRPKMAENRSGAELLCYSWYANEA